MLPETGGANWFTLIVADRLEDLGRPVTLDELIVHVANASGGLPWSWITQRHQANIAVSRRRMLAKGSASIRQSGFDPALGWHVDGYEINDTTTRAALRHCVNKVLSNALRRQPSWVIRDNGRYRRNPDAHPKVHANGKQHSWDSATRAASDAEGAAFATAANRASIGRRAGQLTPEQRATILRHLTGKLPVARKAWTSGQVRELIYDIDENYANADLDDLYRLICRYAQKE